jgi:hypothetical protein
MLPQSVTLKSAGSVSDELDVESGVITRKVGSYTFDGTEAWSKSSASTRTDFKLAISGLYDYTVNTQVPNVMLLGFTPVSMKASWYVGSCSLRTDDLGYFYISLGANMNVSDAQSATVGKTLLFELATPTAESVSPVPNNTIYTEGGGTINTVQTQTPVIDNCLDVGYLAI